MPESKRSRQLLSVAEAADALGLSVACIRVWVSRRKLPRVNCGRAVRIPAEAIAEFIERNTIPAREERRAR
jgi:excisionase family DNA binding protein